MTKLNSLQAPFSDVPCNRFFELELLSRRDDHAEIRMPVKVAYVQEKGVIHGGIITTLADTAAVYAINPDLPPGKTMTSIELKVNFLRPAAADGSPLLARADVIKRGQRVAVCRVDVLQSEKAVATGIFTYLILPTTS
jgi:uncharacterized protein (TIGR00369 family)